MNFVAVFMCVFSLLGAIDRIIGNRFGIGKQYEKGFYLFGNMALSMIGMIVISPILAKWLAPVFGFISNTLHLDPSIIPASLFANDMGGAPLSVEIAVNDKIGMYNALVVSSMMGCTISFTLPYALGAVKKENHENMLVGFLCGIVTIPLGCFVSGLVLRLPIVALLLNLLPLVVFSAIIAIGLWIMPNVCVKIFSVFGTIMKIIISIGLCMGVIEFLTGFGYKELETFETAAMICVNAAVVMSGAFPFLHIVSKLISKPLTKLGKKIGVNETSALGFVSSLATSVTTFEIMENMDKKGVIFNSAFAVSAAFTFAGHLAFTLAMDADYIFPMIIGKLISGVSAVLVALVVYKRIK